jgi:hypothetical protein
MKLTTKFDMQAVDFSKENVVNLRIGMQAPELPDDFERPPASIVALLDKSGSMHGEKFKTLKSTMYRLIENLTDQDQLTIVWFSTGAHKTETVTMDKEGRKTALALVESEAIGGGTNIPEAFKVAEEVFGVRAPGGGMVEKMLLMTDGQTRGSNEEMLEQLTGFRPEVGLSCFGYGAGYNDVLLDELSKAKSGACHFIEDTDMLAEAFGSELGSLLSRYASEAVLKFSVSTDGEFVNLLNDFQVGQETDDGKEWHCVQLGDILYGETKEVFIRVKSNPQDSVGFIEDLVDIGVECLEEDGDNVHLLTSADLKLVESSQVELPDSDIAEQVLLLDAAKTQLEAKDLADKGEWQNAKDIFDAMAERLDTYGTVRTRGYADVMKRQSCSLNASYCAGSSMAKTISSGAYTVMGRRGCAGADSAGYADLGITKGANAFTSAMTDSFVKEDSDDQDKDKD